MLSGFYVMLFGIACLHHLINKIYVRIFKCALLTNFDTTRHKACLFNSKSSLQFSKEASN